LFLQIIKYSFMEVQSMNLSQLARPDVFLVSAATVIIIFAIVITAAVQGPPETFSQVIIVGPVWPSNVWTCTSDANYMVNAVLNTYGNTTSYLTITVSGQGSQPDFAFTPLKMETFSVGGPADSTMTISSIGIITGYITLQTMSDAVASCRPS